MGCQWVAIETMQLHKTKNGVILRTMFLHISGPIKQIYIGVGVITPWDTSLSNDFLPDFFKFSLL